MGYLIAAIVCGGLGLCFAFEGKIENISLDKDTNRLSIKRSWLVPCYMAKMTTLPLSNIIRVHAARRGMYRDGIDNTVYVLIVSMIKGAEIKILETRNASKIRKEVSDRRFFDKSCL
jgi:hypothetical protein